MGNMHICVFVIVRPAVWGSLLSLGFRPWRRASNPFTKARFHLLPFIVAATTRRVNLGGLHMGWNGKRQQDAGILQQDAA